MKNLFATSVTKTLFLTISLFGAQVSFSQLSGSYSIDPSQAASATNYTDINSAVSDMLAGTRTDGGTVNGPNISAAVDFQIADGTYNEQVEITAITGSSIANTVTFESANGDSSMVIIELSTSFVDNYIFGFDGASFITINKLTLHNTNVANCTAVEIQGGCSDITITNCHLEGALSTSISSAGAVIDSGGDTDNNIHITNNRITTGGTSILMSGEAVGFETGTIISNNILETFYSGGMDIRYQNDFTINNNIIISDLSTTMYTFNTGIEIQDCSGIFEMSENEFSGGLYYAINLDEIVSTTSNHFLISNNIINSNDILYVRYGIRIDGSATEFVDLIHNSIYLNNTGASSTGYAIRLGSGVSNTTLTNNIIFTEDGYAIYDADGAAILSSNYNDLIATTGNLGYYGTSAADLAAWQTTTAMDANSISVDPMFVSASDLHIQPTSPCVGAGILTSVTTDIDGETRKSVPDIGADDYIDYTSIEEIENKSFKVYPNPTTGIIQFSIGLNDNTNKLIQVIDLQGRIVKELKISSTILNISNLDNGNYILKITDQNNSISTTKIVVYK